MDRRISGLPIEHRGAFHPIDRCIRELCSVGRDIYPQTSRQYGLQRALHHEYPLSARTLLPSRCAALTFSHDFLRFAVFDECAASRLCLTCLKRVSECSTNIAFTVSRSILVAAKPAREPTSPSRPARNAA